MNEHADTSRSLAAHIAAHYSRLPQVEAVALSGSQTIRFVDSGSDIDLYVYVREPIPLAIRAQIATTDTLYPEINNQFWEPGDEWVDPVTGIGVDVMFRQTSWIEEQFDRMLLHYQASIGYSTCLWYNVRIAHVLYDRHDWFHRLQQIAYQPYPEMLRRAIIAKNYPILKNTHSSYINQLQTAIHRGDLVSANHRVTAFLASYFDILFALNRLPHPGEKHVLKLAESHCTHMPIGMSRNIKALIRAAARLDREALLYAHTLADGIGELLRAEGLLRAVVREQAVC
jgi:hypothetical protein